MPTFDAASLNQANSNRNTITQSHTVAVQANRLLLVLLALRGLPPEYPANHSVAYGGVAMSNIGGLVNNGNQSSLWYLVAPATGANNIVASWTQSTTQEAVLCAASYYDVHQVTPLGTAVTATGNSASPSVTVGSAAGQLVVSALANNHLLLQTVTCGDTSRAAGASLAAGTGAYGGLSEAPGAASVVMDWTISAAALWAIIGVAILPPAAVTASRAKRVTVYPTGIMDVRAR